MELIQFLKTFESQIWSLVEVIVGENQGSHLAGVGEDRVGETEEVVPLQVQELQGGQVAEQSLDVPEMIIW